ncbi:hypothetical protein DFQ09_104203 [Winogradskyella pacifica]|uniref:Uncharacterized protein n=1 Tax=Winogradskyella pacifica TaxID=664642 RepID=A0A3D9MWY3_9FLAO|nr:hypothetical protein [Winogradskyella pacifica]REE24432.1 hypothetical protein DFQ09_104203 [Winogradskyella pacifica]
MTLEEISMEQRKKISSNIIFRKYFLSWFVLLLAYLITEFFNLSRFWDYGTWIIAILAFTLFITLKKVEFSKSAVYFNNNRVEYKSITDLKTFEIQQRSFYLFKTNSANVLKRYYLTQLGGIGYFSIIKILFSKKNASELPLAEFLGLLDEKSNISKN